MLNGLICVKKNLVLFNTKLEFLNIEVKPAERLRDSVRHCFLDHYPSSDNFHFSRISHTNHFPRDSSTIRSFLM